MQGKNFVEPGTCTYPGGSEFETVYVQKKTEFWGVVAFVFGLIGIIASICLFAFPPPLSHGAIGIIVLPAIGVI